MWCMERFLQHHLVELHSQSDMRNLINSLSQRIAAHQSRVCQIVYKEPLKHIEVILGVLLGLAADQPLEGNFFSGILEGLLGRLGIAVPGQENPPTLSKGGAARLWASAVTEAVQKMEKRRVKIETPKSSGMLPRLHLNYEEDSLSERGHQVPGVFTDPLFLPNMVNLVYELTRPAVLAEAPPFSAATIPPTPKESVNEGSGKAEPPTIPAQVMGGLETESDKTGDPEPEGDSSHLAQVVPLTSSHALRKQTHGKLEGLEDSKDGAPSPKRATVKKEVDDSESSCSIGLSNETLWDHRFTVYSRDSTAIHEVRAEILSLEAGVRPTQQDIDSSPIFTLR